VKEYAGRRIGTARSGSPGDSGRDPGCPFCSERVQAGALARHGTVFAIEDRFPVTRGHVLVIPFRHTRDVFTMTEQEIADASELLRELRDSTLDRDPSVTGFNVGANCGASAGQSVMHAHIHLIPRRDRDTDDVRGGIRGVVRRRGRL
jgi:diadenosine tetraphosphate (Ap4A) HIT family hydrolase